MNSTESKDRDGLDSQSTDSQNPHSNSARRNPALANVSIVFMSSSNHTARLLEEPFDDKAEFRPELPTNCALEDQSLPIKGWIVEALLKSDKENCEEMKSNSHQKNGLKNTDRDETVKGSSSHPSSHVNQKEGATANNKNVLLEHFQEDYSTQEEDVSKFVTFYINDNVRDAGCLRSEKYYLPDSSNCTECIKRPGLLTYQI